MNTAALIGKIITGIFEKVTPEFGGLDTGEVVIQLNTGEIIKFPFDFDDELQLISQDEVIGMESVFNQEDSKESTYKITDLLKFNEFESLLFIELANGIYFSEVLVSPHGTGMAGFYLVNDLNKLESLFGKNYIRLTLNTLKR